MIGVRKVELFLTQDEAVELQGGSEREREKLERGGEEWELVVVEEEMCV